MQIIPKEYIEREALIAEYDRVHKGPAGGARKLMVEAPAVDVVKVVRCKDCVFSRELDEYEKKLYLDNCVGCCFHSKSYCSVIMEDTDFCSYGITFADEEIFQRKEGAEE